MGLGEWYQLAVGDVISVVKEEAARRLSDEFGIAVSEVPVDDIRIDAMQNGDRKSDSYRIFVRRSAVSADNAAPGE